MILLYTIMVVGCGYVNEPDFNENEFEAVITKIHSEFPKLNGCFSSLFDNITDYDTKMNQKFTDELTVLVKDDRSTRGNYYWSGCDAEEQQQFINYTTVKGTRDKPITLRNIIEAISEDPHYDLQSVREQDHNFAESYQFISPCVLTFDYGS